jgi:hypothetical protein
VKQQAVAGFCIADKADLSTLSFQKSFSKNTSLAFSLKVISGLLTSGE